MNKLSLNLQQSVKEIKKFLMIYLEIYKLIFFVMKPLINQKKQLAKTCEEIKNEIIGFNWYLHCEHCWRSNPMDFHFHHLVYRSEAPKHRNLHDKLNIILLCVDCHCLFHTKKSTRDDIVIDRELWTLFPEYLKKEHFCSNILNNHWNSI